MHKISVKKRGNKFGLWFFETLVKLFGLRSAYFLLYGVALHYLIFDREAVRGALSYCLRRFKEKRSWMNRVHVYRIFINQGKELIDRYALLSAKLEFDIQLRGFEELNKLLSQKGKGFILLTAHVGNWQIALTALKKMDRAVYLMMRPEDNPAVKDSLGVDTEDNFVKVISPEGFLGGVVEAMSRIKEGNIVSVMGDRKYGFEAISVSFLNDEAYFPFGAFNIAAASGVPIVVLLSAKTGLNKYLVDVSNILYPSYNSHKDKKKQLKEYVQQFAGILENYAAEYPYQCFLFHNVWAKN